MSAEARKFTKDDVIKHINPNCLWVRLVAYDEQQSQNSELAANIGIKADWIEAKMNEAGADAKRIAELVTLLDQQLGTPCEEIRHAQEMEVAQARIVELRHALAELLYVQDGLPMTGIEATRSADQARAALKETGVAS